MCWSSLTRSLVQRNETWYLGRGYISVAAFFLCRLAPIYNTASIFLFFIEQVGSARQK